MRRKTSGWFFFTQRTLIALQVGSNPVLTGDSVQGIHGRHCGKLFGFRPGAQVQPDDGGTHRPAVVPEEDHRLPLAASRDGLYLAGIDPRGERISCVSRDHRVPVDVGIDLVPVDRRGWTSV